MSLETEPETDDNNSESDDDDPDDPDDPGTDDNDGNDDDDDGDENSSDDENRPGLQPRGGVDSSDEEDSDSNDDSIPYLQDRATEDSSSDEDDCLPDAPESSPVNVAPTSPSRRQQQQHQQQQQDRRANVQGRGYGRGCGRGDGNSQRGGYNPTAVPERGPRKREVKKNHLKITDHLYTQTSGHFQTASHRHVPNSGADYTTRKPKGSEITMGYVHAMRAVVETYKE